MTKTTVEQKKYGYLTIKGFSHKDAKSRTYVKCECDCGKRKTMRLSDLKRSDHRKVASCGCLLIKNGVRTSRQAIAIEKMINKLGYKTEHNTYIGKDCVDISLPHEKVCVEYNSKYFHRTLQDKSREDTNKKKRLVRAGWSVLTIQGDREVPSEKQLADGIISVEPHMVTALYLICRTARRKTITLGDWK